MGRRQTPESSTRIAPNRFRSLLLLAHCTLSIAASWSSGAGRVRPGVRTDHAGLADEGNDARHRTVLCTVMVMSSFALGSTFCILRFVSVSFIALLFPLLIFSSVSIIVQKDPAQAGEQRPTGRQGGVNEVPPGTGEQGGANEVPPREQQGWKARGGRAKAAENFVLWQGHPSRAGLLRRPLPEAPPHHQTGTPSPRLP